jgi:hypothetical protein
MTRVWEAETRQCPITRTTVKRTTGTRPHTAHLRALTIAEMATKIASEPPAFMTTWPRSLMMRMMALAMVFAFEPRLTLRSVWSDSRRVVP